MSKINGKMYDWSSIDISLSSLGDIEAQSIDYGDSVDREAVYGRGNIPRGYGEGNYSASGKMTILKEDFNTITDYCKRKNIPLYKLQIPKIVVSYANDGEKAQRDVINKVMIQKIDNKGSQGDKKLTVDLELFIYGVIERDGVSSI